jgi:hypothetical protein
MHYFITLNRNAPLIVPFLSALLIVLSAAGALHQYRRLLEPSPYRPQHTETNPEMDAALSEQFGHRLVALGVAAIVIDPAPYDALAKSMNSLHNCKDTSPTDDNDCYSEPMVARDTRGQTILRFEAHGVPMAEIAVDNEGHVTARLREGTTDLQTFDSALKAASAQIERQVALMEAEQARRASWEPRIEESSPNETSSK